MSTETAALLMPFTAHNIALPDGTQTCPGEPLTIDLGRCRAALALLAEQFPGDRSQVRVADLGCLEGGYTAAFAQAGYTVTGFEARTLNMARCHLVASALVLPNLGFVKDDVRNLEWYGPFDAVFCCGLLYHLDRPAKFLRLLARVTRRLVIIQTHWSQTCHEENEGYAGYWYDDDPGEANAWGSWGNQRSFWLGRDELLRAMRDAGFASSWPVDDGPEGPGRGMFAGLKAEP